MNDAGSAGEGLQRALGADVVELHAAVAFAGCRLAFTARPRDGDELSACLRALGERRLPVLVRGRGTRPGLGNPPRGATGFLCLERLTGIGEFDAQDGVLQVAAGTPVAEVDARVRTAGWELPLDPPGDTTSVGGAIATAVTGPRLSRFGPPRRCILGLQVAMASGERTSCGGRVVKNVTGYDMAKLYAGSLGTLGVIESAWLRLRPAPARVRSFVGVLDAGPRAFAQGLAAARRDSVRVAALVTGAPAARLGSPRSGGEDAVLVVECAGDEAAVARDADWLAAEAGVRPVPDEARLVGRLRELQGSGALRARLAVLPTRLERAVAPLCAAGLGIVVYPGPGWVYAISDDDASDRQLAAVDEAVGAVGADLLFEALPDAVRAGRDVFGDAGERGPLLRAVKQRFDPAGLLNPGRGQGFL